MSRKYDPAIEWVPVSSGQMPELGLEVLGYNEMYGYMIWALSEEDKNDDGTPTRISKGAHGGDFTWHDLEYEDEWPDYWRNLPEPYRGGESK